MALSDMKAAAVVAFPLDEASGNALDAIGSNDLTDVNTVGVGTGHLYGNARDFEASNGERFETTDNAVFRVTNSWFAVMWVRLEDLVDPHVYLCKGVNTINIEWDVRFNHNTGKHSFFLTHTSPYTGVTVESTVSPDFVWQLVAVKHDAANDVIGISVNGENWVEASFTNAPFVSTGVFRIGLGMFSELMDGMIQEVVLGQGYVPTNADLTALYNSGAGVAFADWDAGGGSPVEGTASITLGALTSSAAATLAIAGSATPTLGALTLSAASTITLAGTASITLGALTASAAATITLTASASATLGTLTVTATGGLAIVGEASVTLGALTLAAEGGSSVTGEAAITLGAATVTAAGVIAITGGAGVTLGAVTVAGEGAGAKTGSASITLGSLAAGAVGSVSIAGAFAATLGTLTVSASNREPEGDDNIGGLFPPRPLRLTAERKRRRRLALALALALADEY